MKRRLVFSLFLCSLFVIFTESAYAESSKPKTKLQFRKEMLWHLAALPIYAFLQINVHEGSHALTGLIVGAKVKGYYPYPHIDEKNFVWGNVILEGENLKSKEVCAIILFAPYLADINIFAAADLLISLGAVSPHSVLGGILYFAGMIAPFMDFAINVNGWSSGNDFSSLSNIVGIHRAFFYVAGNVMAGVAIWRLLSVGKKVFFKEKVKEKTPKRKISFLITPTYQMSGISIITRF